MTEPRDSEPPSPPRSKVGDVALTLLLVLSFGAPLIGGLGLAVAALFSLLSEGAAVLLGGVGALATGILLSVRVYRWIRGDTRYRQRAVRAAHVLVLGVMPMWGLAYNHVLAAPSCTVSSCSSRIFRPFAEPQVFALLGLHLIVAIAYLVSRRRPEALRPAGEALIHALLVLGIVVHAALAVHIARWMLYGLLLPPAFLPAYAPAITVWLYAVELRARLRLRGLEAATKPGWRVADSLYRAGPEQEPLPAQPRVHRGMLLRALALAPALFGVYAVIQALWLGRLDAALTVVTGTCDNVLSRLPVVILPEDCHYLCTVAAQGHPWLVRPERIGRRGGVPIVVNRQLAIANAFEDLLHERWPRFGRMARRVYDRVGLPVSRYLRRRWLADATYLAMKPAEWAFAIALLLLDRGDPERRIDRMYR